MPDSEKFVEGVAKEKVQSRIDYYNEILGSDSIDKNSAEYLYAQDVIEEITNLLKKAEEGRSFINSIDIQNRIEAYLKELEYINKEYLESKKEELEEKTSKFDESSFIDDEEKLPTVEELLAEIERISQIEVTPPTLDEIELWKSSKPKTNADIKNELEEVEKAISDLSGRDETDIEIQKRVTKNRIQELQEIDKEKELFKITEKGEIVISYPDIEVEFDIEKAKQDFLERKRDTLDKYYGNKEKAKEYSEAMKRLKSHEKEKEFSYKDEDGEIQKGTYTMVLPYEGMDKDLHFLQLEEYPERLARLTKFRAGDKSAYNDVRVRTGLDEKTKVPTYVVLDPKEAQKIDEQYVETKNNSYNRLAMTKKNLMTLGKYGEKVPYSEFHKGEPVRNVLRGVVNTGKFIRNHVTAPVNKFIGSKIVAPLYGKITGADYKYKGPYDGSASHRYVARREYFASQGKGYFSSRLSSIFKYKEGNKAVTDAGTYDDYDSTKLEYVQKAEKETFEKRAEFASKNVNEKIDMIKADIEKASTDEAKAKLQETLLTLEKAKAQILADRAANQKLGVAHAVQTDAIDITQHDKANKENITRVVTVIKGATRFTLARFATPRIKDWILQHTQTTKTIKTPPTAEEIQAELNIKVNDKRWVPTTYKDETMPAITETRLNTDASMAEVMASNAGKKVEGYYSVYSGEARPAMYDLTGNEKITAIFESVGKGGKGLSDTAGLKAPTLTDGTFASELLEANGVLNQNTTISQMLEAIQNGSISADQLSNVYVSVGDRYWTKFSDLVKDVTKEVVVKDAEISHVIDIPGHYERLTDAEIVAETQKALLQALANPVNRAKVDLLTKTTTENIINERAVKALEHLGIANKAFSAAMGVGYVNENLRNTHSDLDPSKENPRHYNADAGLKGTKKEDVKNAKSDIER